MQQQKSRRTPLERTLWVVLSYLLVGWLWITFSDAQAYKDVLLVLVTGLVLFVLIYRQLSTDHTLLSLHADQREEILQLNQFRESIIERANAWIDVLDTEGRVVLWNRSAEKISGYRRDEVINSDEIWRLLYPDEKLRNEIYANVLEILRDKGEVVGYETRIRSKQGKERLISWNSRSLHGAADESVGSISIGQDITDIRVAENLIRRRDRQLMTLMDNLPGMAYRGLYDDNWTMKFVSSGCEKLTGYQPDELVDNRVISWASLIRGEASDRLMGEVESAIGNAEPFSFEYPIERKDGQQLWVWERGRSVVDDDEEFILEGIIIDITDKKRLEDELSEMATRDAPAWLR